MLKATLSVLLAGALMLTLPITLISAQTAPAPETAQVAKLKAQLAKYGTGKQTKLEVSLRDSTKRSSYLNEIKEKSIILTDAKTGANVELAFADIATAKKRGLSTGAKIALVGIGATVLGIFIFFKTCGNPDVCG